MVKKMIIALAICLTSCATSYKMVFPQSVKYMSSTKADDIEFSYKYDVLNLSGNKKYARRESKKGLKIVAVKITNNSASDFIFGQDKQVYRGLEPVPLINSELAYSQLKQKVPVYLLYLLLTPMTLNTRNSSTQIGLGIGPGLTIFNMAMAGTANSKFKKELRANFLNGRTIKKGETVYGMIAIFDRGFNALTLK